MRPSPETLAELERHKQSGITVVPWNAVCDLCYDDWPCWKASLLAYIRDLEALLTRRRTEMATVHRHGRFQRFACWVGFHPSCCFRRFGLMQLVQSCRNCGMEDAGP